MGVIMKNQIRSFEKNNKFVCVYTDFDNTSKFIFGKIIKVDDEYFSILSFTPNGKSDGVVVKLIDDILKIEYENKYTEKMEKIISENLKDVSVNEQNSQGVVYSVIDDAMKNKRIVSIELNKSGFDDVVGVPTKVTENLCQVLVIDEYGFSDGFSLFDISDITQISISSESERVLEELCKGKIITTGQGTVLCLDES